MTFGESLRGAREARRWSQSHLASVCGISEKTVRQAEANESVQAETAMALCSVLEIPLPSGGQSHRGPTFHMPKPCDDDHAKVLAFLSKEAESLKGCSYVTASDAAAYLALSRSDCPANEMIAYEARKAWAATLDKTISIGSVCVGLLAVAFCIPCVVNPVSFGRPNIYGTLFPGGMILLIVFILYFLFAYITMTLVVEMVVTRSSIEAKIDKLSHASASAEEMKHTVYAVGTEGVEVLTLGGLGISRVRLAAAVTENVSISRTDADHVDVVIKTIGISLAQTLSWIPSGRGIERAIMALCPRAYDETNETNGDYQC